MGSSKKSARIIGLISDTHGLLRPEAFESLRGVELILHAGDVGGAAILEQLGKLAPVIAVRGNVDTDSWGRTLPETAVVETEAASIFMLHDLNALDLKPSAASFPIVISGHSHQPKRFERDGVLYVNPGSAGPKRFQLPATIAKLDLRKLPWEIEFVDLMKSRGI